MKHGSASHACALVLACIALSLVGEVQAAAAARRGGSAFYQDSKYEEEMLNFGGAAARAPAPGVIGADDPLMENVAPQRPVMRSRSRYQPADSSLLEMRSSIDAERDDEVAQRSAGHRFHRHVREGHLSDLHRRPSEADLMNPFNFRRHPPRFGVDPHGIDSTAGAPSLLQASESMTAGANAAAAVNIDDPFAGPGIGGPAEVFHQSPPESFQAVPRAQPFDAPSFTEVESQMREIIDNAPLANAPKAQLAHNMPGGADRDFARLVHTVTAAPDVAPPRAPPPIPMGSRSSGPPLPMLIETQSVRYSPELASRSGAPARPGVETGFVSLSESIRPHAAQATAAAPQQALPPTPQAVQKPKFTFELSPELIERQSQVWSARTASQTRPASSADDARSFIEELAGVRPTQSTTRHAMQVPPPAIKQHAPNFVYHKFRNFD